MSLNHGSVFLSSIGIAVFMFSSLSNAQPNLGGQLVMLLVNMSRRFPLDYPLMSLSMATSSRSLTMPYSYRLPMGSNHFHLSISLNILALIAPRLERVPFGVNTNYSSMRIGRLGPRLLSHGMNKPAAPQFPFLLYPTLLFGQLLFREGVDMLHFPWKERFNKGGLTF